MPTQHTQTVVNAAKIMNFLAAHPEGVTAKVIESHLKELTADVVYRTLNTLEAERIIGRTDEGLWQLRAKFRNHSAPMSPASPLLLQDELDTFAKIYNFAVYYGTLDLDSHKLIVTFKNDKELFRPDGSSVADFDLSDKIHCTGLGRALLSIMPVGERTQFLAEHNLQSYTADTLTDIGAINKMIEHGHRSGFYSEYGECDPALGCVGFVIRTGPVFAECAALAVAYPLQLTSIKHQRAFHYIGYMAQRLAKLYGPY